MASEKWSTASLRPASGAQQAVCQPGVHSHPHPAADLGVCGVSVPALPQGSELARNCHPVNRTHPGLQSSLQTVLLKWGLLVGLVSMS